MRSSLFLLLALMLAPNQVRADDTCPTIELDSNGESAHQLPVWSQGNTPACDAYSASFLASVWIRENWARFNSSFEDYTSLPAENFNIMSSDSVNFPALLDAENGRTCGAFNYIMKLETSKTGDPFNSAYTTPKCEMWGIDLNPSGTHKVQRTPEEFLTRMHENLETQNRAIPYGIEYCSQVFSEPDKTFIINRTYRPTLTYLNSNAAQENFASDCGFHSSAIIGQKMRHGVCYFKVRNSWGRQGLFTPNVERGNFWIPAEALARNTLRLIELKSP